MSDWRTATQAVGPWDSTRRYSKKIGRHTMLLRKDGNQVWRLRMLGCFGPLINFPEPAGGEKAILAAADACLEQLVLGVVHSYERSLTELREVLGQVRVEKDEDE